MKGWFLRNQGVNHRIASSSSPLPPLNPFDFSFQFTYQYSLEKKQANQPTNTNISGGGVKMLRKERENDTCCTSSGREDPLSFRLVSILFFLFL
uniref:Uncharacterized protein n=1 Tax=Caenorhabditis tropicalis TaxID=1561998 RepID=A0A1I7TSI4_9PELO